MATDNKLERRLGLPLITLYGIGTIIGAGIYVLVGKVAGHSGLYTPAAFLCAAFVASFTALSYAELSSRLPRSAGEAVYVQAAFAKRTLTILVGLAVVLIGAVSSATISRGAIGYLQILIDVPGWLLLIIFVSAITFVACRGVLESVGLAALITVIEFVGIVVVLSVTSDTWVGVEHDWSSYVPELEFAQWQGVFAGAFLAFYAYIGFEDMVNMAEEVRDPSRVMPRAIILALIVTSILYALVALAAVNALPIEELAQSEAPFATLVQENSNWVPVWGITLVSLVAVTNGALVQIIMGARVLYGMSVQELLPAFWGRVHSKLRTPVNATLLTGSIVACLALAVPLETLARATSLITLLVFLLVNLALLVLKLRDKKLGDKAMQPPIHSVSYPILVPLIGMLLCAAFLVLQLF